MRVSRDGTTGGSGRRLRRKDGSWITQDLDFSDIRQFAPGSHHGLLLVRLRDPGRLALTQAVREAFATQDTTGWQGCFIVLTENKIRVVRPEA